jgi:glycosyltransferase involved in cell wall biosynthesis
MGELIRRLWKGSEISDYVLVATSGWFDREYYLERYADIPSHRDPLRHYLRYGWREGRDPGPAFDASWYLDQYSDVRSARINPLVHYLRHGYSEGRLPKKPGASSRAGAPLGPYESWLEVNTLSDRDIQELQEKLEKHATRLPTISVIVTAFNTEASLLERTIKSVSDQIFDRWEVCLVDDGSSVTYFGPLLDRLANADKRIHIKRLPANAGISAATNAAVEMACGEILVFLDHDDVLSRDCLAELAIYYADHPEADVVFSDDDKIDALGGRYAPQFKPGWSPTLLLSWMYIGHVFSVRIELFQRIGGFRAAFDGSQDYDFALRGVEVAREVGHIPKVLYHWRAVKGSTATGGRAKPLSIERGLETLRDALRRRGATKAMAVHPDWAKERDAGFFDIVFPDEGPSVTIIIDARAMPAKVEACLQSVRRTTYRNFDVLVVGDGQYAPPGGHDESASGPPVSYFPCEPANANALNEAASECSSQYLLFLTSNADVVNPGWLSQLVGYALLEHAGAVGARIHSRDGTIRHAGLVHGLNEGLVGSAFKGLPVSDPGYLALTRTSREIFGVYGGCLLTPRSLFEELGGFDTDIFPVSYSAADYCCRLLKAGSKSIYCASAVLRLDEDETSVNDSRERAAFRKLYGQNVDPWYNRNLSLENGRFEIEPVRPETSRSDRIRLIVVSHNLNNEGAPTTLLDLITGLTEAGYVEPIIVSMADGPLRKECDERGVRVVLVERLMSGVYDRATQLVACNVMGMMFRSLGADLVFANTLHCYWAVKAAQMAGLPSIWAQHESGSPDTFFDYLPQEMREAAYQAFADAYRVIYVAEATRRAWRSVETRRNFKVIRHAIPPNRLEGEMARWTRQAARCELGLATDALVLSTVGTVCRRKGQTDLLRAYALLQPEVRAKVFIYLVGSIGESDYGEEAQELARKNAQIVMTGRVEDPFLYYKASDIFICSSRVESAPRVLMEAMASGLPIITTPVFGIPEIVSEGVNALFYQPGDVKALARAIEKLFKDRQLRSQLASNSPVVLDGHPGFSNMVEQYGSVMRQSVNLKLTAPGPTLM